MPDEVIDTQVASPEDTAGDTGAEQTEVTETTTEVTTPIPPAPPSPDEIIRQAEERAFQRTASWMGRRDKDLMDHIGNLIDSRIRTVAPLPASTDPTSILDDPDRWTESKIRAAVPQILNEEIQKRMQADQGYTAGVIQHAARIMDSDPLFEDKTFGAEVVAEAQKQFGTLQKNIPPDVAAELLINKALASVNRRKMLEKKNPLAGNQPGKVVGGITAPPAPAAKPKVPKLSESAQALAKRWGYSAEDLAKVFKDE